MSLKTTLKTLLLGRAGDRQRLVKRGLLKGLRFNIDTNSKSQRLLGLDEREIASDIASLAQNAQCALDIGANDGWYAVFFASKPNIRSVYAFEPDHALNDQLVANFRLNDPALLKKIVLVSKLVGNKDDAQWCSIDVAVPDPPRPVLLKIDVEGGEMDVLRGAKKTLQGDCLLVVETHGPELERDCIAFLQDLQYACRIVKNGWYRSFVPEARQLPHNRWLVARRPAGNKTHSTF